MTARQVFEATLIELSKVNAPSLKLYEFNYLFNKAINQYINKVYNIYDINQQTTDDIRVLKSTAYLNPVKTSNGNNSIQQSLQGNNSANFEVALPQDYLHILNCICVYYVSRNISCYNAGDYIEIPALRLTADSWSGIITDVYNRPSPMRPYYYIHNVNKQNELPTNIYDSVSDVGTDQYFVSQDRYIVNPLHLYFEIGDNNIAIPKSNVTIMYDALKAKLTSMDISYNANEITTTYPIKYTDGNRHLYFSINSTAYYMWLDVDNLNDLKLFTANQNPQNSGSGNANRYIDLQIIKVSESTTEFPRQTSLVLPNNPNGSITANLVQKDAYLRASNPSKVRCEIRYGKDSSVYQLKQVVIDYIKSPQNIRLTQQQIDLTEDTSQIMEFPDYVNQEIINELVHLVMERENNPRLSNHMQMTQSIVRPTQQQTQQQTT